jgi:predicted dehydrogenase
MSGRERSTKREKQTLQAELVKLLRDKRTERGMTLIAEGTRCIRRGEIHELVTTDRDGGPGDRIDRVGFLGFAEFGNAGVVETGDLVQLEGRAIGRVLGFDQCHYPNHYNILIRTSQLLSAADLALHVGDVVRFRDPQPERVATAVPTLVVGFGHAGQTLHLPCIRKVRQRESALGLEEPVLVADPALRARRAELPRDVCLLDDFRDLPLATRERVIVHVCTPPRGRLEVLHELAHLGYRRFIVEKPMVADPAGLDRLRRLREELSLDLLVVSNWVSSVLTRALEERLVDHGGLRALRRLAIRQRKSRVGRSLREADSRWLSAYDIEMPHMVALALALIGDVRLTHARCWDLRNGHQVVSGLGGAEMVLEAGETRIRLASDLTSPVRERSVCCVFKDGSRLVGHHPNYSADHYSQLFEYDGAGRLIDRRLYEDDTLTQFLAAAYAWFLGVGPRPRSDFEFHTQVCVLLNQAREWVAPTARRRGSYAWAS